MSRIDDAFSIMKREKFVLSEYKNFAYEDRPLPIGYSQTISQPSTVRKMLEWLDVQPGNNVLDIGSGSGWTTALLSHLVGPSGHVYAVEIIPELVEMGRRNCEKLHLENVSFAKAKTNTLGLVTHAPYDRILVSATAELFNENLYEQVAPGGKIVVPIRNSILEMSHNPTGWKIDEHYGFAFVPLKE